MDPEKREKLQEYLDQFLAHYGKPHPFERFDYSEIVEHPKYGLGIVTGFKIKDEIKNIVGLGVQFVHHGRMTFHTVFSPDEARELRKTGVIFDPKRHRNMTLEEILEHEEE